MRIDSFFDSEPFWVIWQVSRAPGGNRIRRISQDFKTEARAIAEAERFRQSGAITWIEEAPARPGPHPSRSARGLEGNARRHARRREPVGGAAA